MAGMWDKLKDAAVKLGKEGAKNPRLVKTAKNIAGAVDAFKDGYQQKLNPEQHKAVCPHCQGDLPPKARYCPQCGAQVD